MFSPFNPNQMFNPLNPGQMSEVNPISGDLSISVLITPTLDEYDYAQVLFGMRCLWQVGLWGVESLSLFGSENYYPDGTTVDSKLKVAGFRGIHSSEGGFLLNLKSDGDHGATLELENETWTFDPDEIIRLRSQSYEMIYNPSSYAGKEAFIDFVQSLDDLYLAELFQDLIGFNTEDPEHVPDIVFDIYNSVKLGDQNKEEDSTHHATKIGEALTGHIVDELSKRFHRYFESTIQGDAQLLREAIYYMASKLDDSVSRPHRFFNETCRAFLSYISTDRLIERSPALLPTKYEQAIFTMLLILDREEIEKIPPVPQIPAWQRRLAYTLNWITGLFNQNH